jgi:transposase
MVYLSEELIAPMNYEELKGEALRYSNLCKAPSETIRVLEAQVKKMAGELGSQHQIVLFAQAQLDAMKDRMFGKSSEQKAGVSGLPLFDPTPEEKKKVEYERKPRTKFGRTPQPELPKVVILHELPEAEVKEKNLEKIEGQFEISELVNLTPAKFQLEIHQRQKYREKAVDPTDPEVVGSILTAPGVVRLKEGSRYSLEFAITVGINKYRWHLPLDRQVRQMKSQGLICTSQVLYSQVDTVCWYLKNKLMPQLKQEALSSKVHQGDETYWKNLGKSAQKRFWLWSLRSGRVTVFQVFDSRKKEVAQEFLAGLSGTLITDGYQGYRCLASPTLVLANDWSHVRRKFIAAKKTHLAEALFFITQIDQLFALERSDIPIPLDHRLFIRQAKSTRITESIYEKCIELKNTLPQSPLGKAIQYTLKLWGGLTVFLTRPEVPIHTNEIESAQRAPVVGRNNHFGSKSLDSAQIAAVWYSIVATCDMNQVDPHAYLLDTMTAILTHQPVLTPWQWKVQIDAQPKPIPS